MTSQEEVLDRRIYKAGLFPVVTNGPKISGTYWNNFISQSHNVHGGGSTRFRVRNSHQLMILPVSWQRKKNNLVKTYHFYTLSVKASYTAIPEFT